MTLSVEYLKEYTLIKISGSFEAPIIAPTQAFFDKVVAQINQNIVIDLSLTTRIDSSGIGVITFLFKRLKMAGYTLTLVGLQGQLLKKMQALELNKVIEMSFAPVMKKKLIVFGEDWGRFPSSTQHLINGLLDLNWEIIWINSLGMRKPNMGLYYIKRLLAKTSQYLSGKRKRNKHRTPANLSVVYPLLLPFYGVSLIDSFNRFILQKQLARLIKKKEFTHSMVWISMPTAQPYLKLFKNQPIIYYCCDEFSVFEGVEPHKIMMLENKLINEAHLIIVSSKILAQKMPVKKTIFIDHGVNLQLFQEHYPRPKDLPRGKLIAGFFGSLSGWIDIDLISACAKRLPAWNFVLIGPKTIDISHLTSLDNVFYLGCKPWKQIPAYAEHFDVCLLPFIKNPHTLACNPMQVKEYLAYGKPVVSIEIPALEPYRSVLYLVKNDDGFIHAIELAAFDKNSEHRKNSVKNLDWNTKAAIIEQKMLQITLP